MTLRRLGRLVPSADSTSIASLYNKQCIPGFDRLCNLLDDPDCDLTIKRSRLFVVNECGRLRAWAGNSGAHRVETSKLSLDHRLREASHMHRRITGLLVELDVALNKALAAANGSGMQDPAITRAEEGSESSDSDSDSSTDLEDKGPIVGVQPGAESNVPDSDTHERLIALGASQSYTQPQSRFDYLLADIRHIITCLYQLSITIQDPAPRDRLHKFNKIRMGHFEFYETLHVQDRFPEGPEYLHKRLAKANVRRRQILKYYQNHQTKIKGITASGDPRSIAGPIAKREVVAMEPPVNLLKWQPDTPGTAMSEYPRTVSTALNSYTTLATFMERDPDISQDPPADPVVDVDDESDAGRSQTSYATSSGGTSRLCIPQPPTSPDGTPFECPYCFLIIKPKNHYFWMNHVLQDLHPYVCTFLECPKPDRLFSSRQQWFDHELEVHRRHWFCKKCAREFEDSTQLAQHIETNHHLSGPLELVIQHCEGPIQAEQPCPLCGATYLPSRLRSHLARHMQELALFALPRTNDGDDDKSLNSESAQASLLDEDCSERSFGDTSEGSSASRDSHRGEPRSRRVHDGDMMTDNNVAGSTPETYDTPAEGHLVVKVGDSIVTFITHPCSEMSTCQLQPRIRDTNHDIHALRHEIARNWGFEIETMLHSMSRFVLPQVVSALHMEELIKLSAVVPVPEKAIELLEAIYTNSNEEQVENACVYCRRSHMTCDEERPCGRCLKRNIGHLCHDEPREPKKPKQEVAHSDSHEEAKTPLLSPSTKPPMKDISIISLRVEDIENAVKMAVVAEWNSKLHDAAFRGDLSMIRKLQEDTRAIRKGAHFQVTSSLGMTALHLAAWAGHLDVVTKLLEVGADIDAMYEDRNRDFAEGTCTALHLAAARGHKEIVKTLIAHGADAGLPGLGDINYTPLGLALKGGHRECAETLLESLANTNAKNTSPLWTQTLASVKEKITEMKLNGNGLTKLDSGTADKTAKEIQQLVSNWESDRQMTPNMLNAPDSGVMEELLNIAQRKRQESEERRWGFEFVHGRRLLLQAMLEKIIDFAKKFRDIGSIAMQYDPGHAALPWAGFVLILHSAISDQVDLAHILSGLEDIAGILAEKAFYEALYLRPQNQALFSDSIFRRFQKSLEDLHESIISYLADTMLTTRRSVIKNFPTAPSWIVRKLSPKMADVVRRYGILKEVVKLLEMRAKDNTNKPMDQLKELETQLSLILRRPLLRYDEKLNGMLEFIEVTKRSKILRWLSVINYPNHHAVAQKNHVPGTGQWILHHEEFLRWRESSGSACLWIKGNAGTGKTKLATHVIQNLINDLGSSINSEGFAYFYCDRDDPERRKPESIISTLVKQLASLNQQGPLHSMVIKEYTSRPLNNRDPSPLNFDDGRQLIRELCDTYPRSWILIDALDECDPVTRYELLHALQDLNQNCSSLVKIFITSRPEEDILAVFNPIPTILLDPTRVGTDIKKIAAFKVNEAITKRGLLSGKLKPEQLTEFEPEMTRILIEGAHGMPLWISYQIESVCQPNRRKFQKPEELLNALEAFPIGLTNTYNLILQDILEKPNDEYNAVAITAFQWVMAAVRPMNPNELLGAIDPHAESNLELESVFRLCKHLLVHDEARDVIRFYHPSVRQYLESQTTCGDLFNMDITRSLLIEPGLLLLAQVNHWFEAGEYFDSAVIDTAHPQTQAFLCYTAWNWSGHVAQDTESKGLIKLLQNPIALSQWFLSCIGHKGAGDQIRFLDDGIFGCRGGPLLPLRVAAYWGLYRIMKLLVGDGGSPKDPRALEIALRNRNEAVIKYLVENGAIADNSRTVVYAARDGHEQIVKYLVENGSSADNPKALLNAAMYGHEQIVKYLVDNGAKANNPDAVWNAAEKGYEQIVKYLVENGAKADNSEAVVGASVYGYDQIVKYLVENGAEANNSRAMIYAARNGHEQIVKFLVKNGAKADNPKAVENAAEKGHEQTVKFLVENGAKADNPKAVEIAAKKGHEQIVKYLKAQAAIARER